MRACATGVLAGAVAVGAVAGVPAWAGDLQAQSTVDGSADSRAATRWILDNLPRDAVVVTDDYIWMDLTLAGFSRPVWLWKVDTDPEVMAEVLPDGVRSIDYIVMADQAVSTLRSLPTLKDAVLRSTEVTRFGEIVVRRVVGAGP